jgi:MFS family permease
VTDQDPKIQLELDDLPIAPPPLSTIETPPIPDALGLLAPDDDATDLPPAAGSHDPAEDEPADGGSSNAIGVLRNRNFLLLWLSQAATQIGGNMVVYGLTVLIYSATKSNSAVSLLLLTFLAPAVFFSAIAGVYVDRLDRRIILIVTNLLRALFFALVYLASGNVLAIFVLNIAISTVTTFFAPAEAAMIPVLVDRKQLLAANGLFTFTQNAAFALGFALLGPLVVNLAGPEALILTVAALYLVASGFTIILPSVPGTKTGLAAREAVHGTEQAVATILHELREGFGYIRAHRNITWSLIYLGVTASLIGVLGVLGPAFATDALGLAPKDFVVVVLPLGMGIVTGILLLNSYGKYFPRRRVMEGGLVGLGVLLTALSAAGPITRFLQRAQAVSPLNDSGLVSLLAVVVGIGFLAGIAYALVAIPAQVGLQEELPEEVRGRVFGVLNMLVSVASFIPIIIVGPISDLVGTTVVLVVVGLSVTGIGVVSVLSHRPHPTSSLSAGA